MLWLKLLAPVFLLLGSITQYLISYRWDDKRTKWHRRARRILPVVLVVAGLTTIAVVIAEHRSSQSLTETLNGLDKNFKQESKNADVRDKRTQADNEALTKQVASLEKGLQPFLNSAQSRYPNLSPELALQKLAEQIAIKATANFKAIADLTIRQFSSSVQMTLSGDWVSNTPSGVERPIILPDDSYITFVHVSGDKAKDIRCFPTAISRKKNADGTVNVSVEANVRPGNWPLGATTAELTGYNHLEFGVAMIDRSLTRTPVVLLENASFSIFVNGVRKLSISHIPKTKVYLPDNHNLIRVVTVDGNDLLAEARQ
jgi:hypothetical protein